MENKKYKIVLVDDDPVLLDLHGAYMENNGYEIISACNGIEALEIINAQIEEIGLIISDVSMPEMDGYELCEKIKQSRETSHLSIIFVSALSSLEEKLKGYSVGADDYIIKPVAEKELLEKSRLSIERQKHIVELNNSVKESNNLAMEALTYSSELVQVIEFNKQMLSARNYNELGKHLFKMAESYQLVCTLQIHIPGILLNLCANGIVSPLEADVIEMARNKAQFFDFGEKTIVNYECFSLLIKNMPVSEHEKYNRIKDIFRMLASGIEGKIKQLRNDIVSEKEHKAIISIKESISNVD